MEENQRGIFVTFFEEVRNGGTYHLYNCSCCKDPFAYDHMVEHLRKKHGFTLQSAEVIIHYAKHPTVDPDDWMR
jgi:hypothetical protein